MAALKINVSNNVHSRLKTQAKKNGFRTVEQYVETMLVVETAGPQIDDQELERLLLSRIDGPFVEVDHADFQRMRQKLQERLDAPKGKRRR
jgi:hypothetical protein